MKPILTTLKYIFTFLHHICFGVMVLLIITYATIGWLASEWNIFTDFSTKDLITLVSHPKVFLITSFALMLIGLGIYMAFVAVSRGLSLHFFASPLLNIVGAMNAFLLLKEVLPEAFWLSAGVAAFAYRFVYERVQQALIEDEIKTILKMSEDHEATAIKAGYNVVHIDLDDPDPTKSTKFNPALYSGEKEETCDEDEEIDLIPNLRDEPAKRKR